MAKRSLGGLAGYPHSTLALCIVLAACGGGGSGGSIDTPVTVVSDDGETTSSPATTDSEADAALTGRALGRVTFFEFPDVNPNLRFLSAQAEFASADAVANELEQANGVNAGLGCTVGPVGISSIQPLLSTPERISAGELLEVNGPSDFVLELQATNVDGRQVYQSLRVAQESADVLDSLRLDLPGAAFPAHEAVPVPTNTPLSNLDPQLIALIRPDTSFRWNRGSSADVVRITVVFEELGETDIEVMCRVSDNGRWELPASVQSELDGRAARSWTIQREATTEIISDEAVLQVIRLTSPSSL